jgi:hypothetical protein
MQIQVTNFRKGPFGTALAFFDVALSETFIMRGFALKKSKAGKYYYQSPSKPRTDKQGQPVKGDDGYQIYDAFFDMYGEKNSEGKYTPTEAGWDGRETIITQAVALLESGAPAASRKPKATASATSAKASAPAARPEEFASATDDAGDASADDDDLPF